MYTVTKIAIHLLFYIAVCVGQCPEKWIMFQDYCLGYENLTKSWLDAESTCQVFTGHLTAPSTETRDINLKAFLRLKNARQPVWVDGTDQMEIGFWEWQSTGERLTYEKWLPGEPNYLNSQKCIAVIDGDDHWRNRDCKDKNAFVCEIKARHGHGGTVA